MKRLPGIALLAALIVVACDDGVEPLTDGDVAGFRIVEGSTTHFVWRESQNQAADTLFLTDDQPLAVRFVWVDAAGAEVNVPADAELEVTISNASAASWLPDPIDRFHGTFDPGPFPEVETAMRVRLFTDEEDLFVSPLLQLHVRP